MNPFVGKRLGSERIGLDVTAGMDMGFGLSSHERGNVGFHIDTYRPLPAVDFRPRLNLTGYYRAFGLSVGYSHGITNYSAGQFGNRPEVYSRMWRVGVTYRLGKLV